MALVVYLGIAKKLREKHQVEVAEVEQAFLNRTGRLAKEVRAKNQGEHPRFWFIAETDAGRRLKVVYALDPEEAGPLVITAYEPDETEENLYASLQRR